LYSIVLLDEPMNTLQKLVLGTSAVSLMLVLNARKGLTTRGKSIAVATGIGGIAGSLLTAGSATGSLGGAAVGSLIGNQMGK
jgi:osmotically inducible lipoprotein OsmB